MKKKGSRKQYGKRIRIMKKSFIAFAAIVGVIAAATTVSAAGVTREDAQKKALEAANVKEDQVIFKQADTDTDDGRQIFEVDFFVPGEMKYEFDIDANTGAILEQEIDLWEADDDMEYADLIKAAGTDVKAAETVEGEISELQAKMIALKDSGFKADEVTFTRCRRDQDDGTWQYEVELKLADGTIEDVHKTELDQELSAAFKAE